MLGQEVGHRWLAYFNFRDHTGQQSEELLGRDLAHWSFFMDSDASVMEGNDIEDLGGGSFRTVAAVRRYSRLDQYAMGLLSPAEVPTFFYVQSPVNMSQQKTKDSAPQTGVTFNGTRRDVLIDDVIAIHGARVPAAAQSPRVHRQAFLYVVGAGRSVDSGAGRQGRSHQAAVGSVLPAGHRRTDARGYAARPVRSCAWRVHRAPPPSP